MQTDDREELDWLAFRYIANEMTASEIEVFEGRLCEDQAAREAVARAVDLSRSLASVGPEILPLTAATRRRRVFPWLAAVAAGIAAAIFLRSAFHPSSELSRLARVWARHLKQESSSVSEFFAGPEDAASIDDDDEPAVPSWLIEAVGGAADSGKWEDS